MDKARSFNSDFEPELDCLDLLRARYFSEPKEISILNK